MWRLKNDLVHLSIALGALVAGAALEEMLPKFAHAGFPFLLMAAVFFASRRKRGEALMFAVAAGAVEDALSSLPFATSIAFFALVAAFVHTTQITRVTYIFVYPVYELWMRMWTSALEGDVFSRFLVAMPVGAVTALAAVGALAWLDGKGAVDVD